MLYEMRTYNLKPGTVAEYEERFAKTLPNREKHSKLGAFWHTDFGPLNQVIHIWPYEDMAERARVRAAAAQEPDWPPKGQDLIVSQESEILLPAPFMRPLERKHMGNVYEMRIYTYQPGTIPEVLKRWSDLIAGRERFSPLAACLYTDVGALNRFIHIWPYRDLAEREKARNSAREDGHWPPPTREFILRQENKVLIPAAFSPLK